jgi:hypothetical protein
VGLVIKGNEFIDELLEDMVGEVAKADSKVGITVKEVGEGLVLILDHVLEEAVSFGSNAIDLGHQFQEQDAGGNFAFKLRDVLGKEEVLSGVVLHRIINDFGVTKHGLDGLLHGLEGLPGECPVWVAHEDGENWRG